MTNDNRYVWRVADPVHKCTYIFAKVADAKRAAEIHNLTQPVYGPLELVIFDNYEEFRARELAALRKTACDKLSDAELDALNVAR